MSFEWISMLLDPSGGVLAHVDQRGLTAAPPSALMEDWSRWAGLIRGKAGLDVSVYLSAFMLA